MLDKKCIIFEDELSVERLGVNRQAIVDTVCGLANTIIEELGIRSLNRIVIGGVVFESRLGQARMSDHRSEITLSYETAVNLIKGQEESVSPRYIQALATCYHELYHVRDYEQMGARLLARDSSVAVSEGFDLWTEFFATFLTFAIREQEYVYDCFEASFCPKRKDDATIRYYTARILGYYLQSGHRERCDALTQRYLRHRDLKATKELLLSMINRYPDIHSHDLSRLKELIDNCISGEYDFEDLGEEVDIFSILRERAKSNL